MTQPGPTNFYDPLSYASLPPPRPTGVTVMAIIGIVFASLTVLWRIIVVLGQVGQISHGRLSGMFGNIAVIITSDAGSLILAATLMTLSFLALNMARRVPRLMVIYGIVAIVFQLAISLWVLAVFDPTKAPLEPLKHQRNSDGTYIVTDLPGQWGALLVLQVIILTPACAVPLAMIITFSLRPIRDAFSGARLLPPPSPPFATARWPVPPPPQQ